MNKIDTNGDIEKLISENTIALIYFGSENCNVCTAMRPKIEKILKDYPKIASAEVDTEKSIQIAAEYSIFTIPVVLLYIEGKEAIREARHISIEDISNKIERYYKLIFN